MTATARSILRECIALQENTCCAQTPEFLHAKSLVVLGSEDECRELLAKRIEAQDAMLRAGIHTGRTAAYDAIYQRICALLESEPLSAPVEDTRYYKGGPNDD
jgi:hypothetical protein